MSDECSRQENWDVDESVFDPDKYVRNAFAFEVRDSYGKNDKYDKPYPWPFPLLEV
jgi:hypothetical protein